MRSRKGSERLVWAKLGTLEYVGATFINFWKKNKKKNKNGHNALMGELLYFDSLMESIKNASIFKSKAR